MSSCATGKPWSSLPIPGSSCWPLTSLAVEKPRTPHWRSPMATSSSEPSSTFGALGDSEETRKWRSTMKQVFCLLLTIVCLSEARAQDVKRNIPYVKKADERQVLDVYSPKNAKDLP